MNKTIFIGLLIFTLLLPLSLLACSKGSGSGGCDGKSCESCSGNASYTFDGSEEDAKSFSSAAISTASLAALMKAKVPMVLIDCRSGSCFEAKHIPGAKIVPDQTRDEEIKTLLPNKDLLIVLYDGNKKCKARREMADRLKDLGYPNIIEYPAGFVGWVAAGKEVAATQVQEKK